MRLVPKNWDSFQHYKDRNPPWIKLHKGLLNDRAYTRLPLASKALAPLMWLLASESKDGSFDADVEELTFRLRMTDKEVNQGLPPLIRAGFFVEVSDASAVLAGCEQVAPKSCSETETETETEGEGERAAIAPPPTRKPKPAKTEMPDGFDVSDRVRGWAEEKGYGRLDEHLDAFKRKVSAKGYTYASWDDAFMEAVREDWAKLRGRTINGAVSPARATRGLVL